MSVLPSLLVALFVLQGSAAVEPATACEESRRIELALTLTVEAREICVSPGMMTGFLFDTPLEDVELQDEVRFVEVLRGQRGISFVPPQELARGERLRLTARFGTGAPQERITFFLVAHRGQATRQVDVYLHMRPRESYQQEIEEERAKNQRLRQEKQELRAELERARGLRSLLANGTVGLIGVLTLKLANPDKQLAPPDGAVSFKDGASYRTEKTVAVQVWLWNSNAEPWMTHRASLVDANGEEVPGLHLRQDEPVQPNKLGSVIVEVDADRNEAHGEFKLTLWDEKSRVITIPGVRFP